MKTIESNQETHTRNFLKYTTHKPKYKEVGDGIVILATSFPSLLVINSVQVPSLEVEHPQRGLREYD